MKKYAFTVIAILLLSVAATAQKRAGKTKKPVVGKAATVKKISRQRFDPKRDPAADLAAAIKTASAAGKRIILDIGGEWCGWCIELDEYFLLNPALKRVRDRDFVWVKINMSPENENKAFLSKYPAITGYPHLFVLESDGSLLHSQETGVLEENLPPVVKKYDANGKPALIDLGNESYDLYRIVEFLKKWSVFVPQPDDSKQ